MNDNVMTVNEQMKSSLLSSAKWATCLSILSCIFSVLFVATAIFLFYLAKELNEDLGAFASYAGYAFLILSAIYIFPIVKGFMFASNTKAAFRKNSMQELACAFNDMLSWFVYSVILTIIGIIGYIYVIIKLKPFITEFLSY